MFDHLEITAVEKNCLAGKPLDEGLWHRDIWSIIEYFFNLNKYDAEIKKLSSVYPGLPHKIYLDLTFYYERRGLPAFKSRVIQHITDTLNKYYNIYNDVAEKSSGTKKDCTVVPFEIPGDNTKPH